MHIRCIIKNHNQTKVLLCSCYCENTHLFFLPGGSIEFQEISTDAIYRELKEEMGLEQSQINILSFRAAVENIYKDHHGIEIVYNVSLSDENVASVEDHIKFVWQDIDKLEEVDFRPNIMKSLIREELEGYHFISYDK